MKTLFALLFIVSTTLGKIHSPLDYNTSNSVLFLPEVYGSEMVAQLLYPDVDFNVKGMEYRHWTLDAAAVMQAYEMAAKDVRREGDLIIPGQMDIPPGVYYISMGHVHFDSAVEVTARGAVFAAVDAWNAGSSPTWCAEEFGLGTREARAVISIGTDYDIAGFGDYPCRDVTIELPAVFNPERRPYRPLHEAQGAAYRFLAAWGCTYKGISWEGPFKYGIILCARYKGAAYNKYHFGQCGSTLVQLKWRNEIWMNSLFFYDGTFEKINPSYLYSKYHQGHDMENYPTTMIDYCNTVDNPNDPVEEHEILDRFWKSNNHYQFFRCGFENNDYIQFWRAHNPHGWKFYNIRFEAMNRPTLGVGGRIWKREPWAITGNSVYANEFIDNFDNSHFTEIPEKYIMSGGIDVQGRGMPSGINMNGESRPLYQQFTDISIERAGGAVILYDETGKRRYINHIKSGELVTEQLPYAEIYWKRVGVDTVFRNDPVVLEDSTKLTFLIRVTADTTAKLWWSLRCYGFIDDQRYRDKWGHWYGYENNSFQPSSYLFGDESTYGFTNYELRPESIEKWRGGGWWTLSLNICDTSLKFNKIDNSYRVQIPNMIRIE